MQQSNSQQFSLSSPFSSLVHFGFTSFSLFFPFPFFIYFSLSLSQVLPGKDTERETTQEHRAHLRSAKFSFALLFCLLLPHLLFSAVFCFSNQLAFAGGERRQASWFEALYVCLLFAIKLILNVLFCILLFKLTNCN